MTLYDTTSDMKQVCWTASTKIGHADDNDDDGDGDDNIEYDTLFVIRAEMFF